MFKDSIGKWSFIGSIICLVGVALTTAMIVAIATVEIEHVIPKGIGPLDCMSWFLYLPQVLYIILFSWLIIAGPGKISLDHFLAKKLSIDSDS